MPNNGVSAADFNSWNNSAYERSFHSFSGTDILATFNGVPIAELQGLSYTVQRETVPVYIMGRKDPIGYSKGKRGIAGSMVCVTFDRSAIVHSIQSSGRHWARLAEVNNYESYEQLVAALNTTQRQKVSSGLSVPTGVVLRQATYADEIPPFNIVLVAANGYGGGSTMSIIGCEIVNDGGSISIDDSILDQSMTFVARRINPWEPLKYVDPARASLSNPTAQTGGEDLGITRFPSSGSESRLTTGS